MRFGRRPFSVEEGRKIEIGVVSSKLEPSSLSECMK